MVDNIIIIVYYSNPSLIRSLSSKAIPLIKPDFRCTDIPDSKIQESLSYKASPTESHPSNQVRCTDIVRYMSPSLIRPLPSKTTLLRPLIRSDFRCTDIAKYRSLSLIRPFPPKTIPLIKPDFICTDITGSKI